jgi:hypothetical protein
VPIKVINVGIKVVLYVADEWPLQWKSANSSTFLLYSLLDNTSDAIVDSL